MKLIDLKTRVVELMFKHPDLREKIQACYDWAVFTVTKYDDDVKIASEECLESIREIISEHIPNKN